MHATCNTGDALLKVLTATGLAALGLGIGSALAIDQSGEQKDMRRVGHTDLQGRAAYHPYFINYPDGRVIAFVGTHSSANPSNPPISPDSNLPKPNPLQAGSPIEANGTMIVDVTDPKNVKFELDIFWAHHGSADPVALLKQYPDRFVLTHMKDMKPGTKKDFTGHAADDTSVALGTGEVNVKGVVEAARGTAVQWHIIEEESPDPDRNVPAGLAYLHSLGAPR